MVLVFKDRIDAGRRLAQALSKYNRQKGLIVLAIPRGGIVIGAEVARALGAELDVVVAKKIGMPGNPELAIGAVSHNGVLEVDQRMLSEWNVPQSYIEEERKRLEKLVEEKYQRYVGGKRLSLKGKIVILTDDGIATGATMIAAARFVKTQKPAKIVIAVPTGPPDNVEKLKAFADEVIALDTPIFFSAVGQFYKDFSEVTDEQAIELVKKFREKK